ncbi:MAG: ImmA/IrrE family metallo-endopeptidase, partial [archaeon]
IEKRLFLSKDNPRDFLKKIITVIEDYNVIVLEFIDNSKKEKINFEGIFLKPNIIVLKRQQKYLKREIFTLMHEFAHFLINNEEIDFDAENKINKDSHIEKWCNDFSYFFLAGNYDTELNKLQFANKSTNNFYDEEISSFCSNTYLSKSAYYTRLKIINKISDKDYSEILESIRESIQKENIERAILLEQEREMLKERGDKSFFTAPKPIRSKIVTDILRFNYASGNINQSDVSYFVRTTGDRIHDIID